MANPIVTVLPHSSKEEGLETPEGLAEWIGTGLKHDGKYLIATISTKHKALCPGSICLFMKNKKIVGEGILKDFVQKYTSSEVSPVTLKPYDGILVFEPTSLRRYTRFLELAEIYEATGKNISFRSGGNLAWEQYGKCLSLVVKDGFC